MVESDFQCVDRTKSLQDLDGEDWGTPPYDSYLVTTCHKLRKKPLKDFTTEDVRIMIGQNICLKYLLPIALEKLKLDALSEGDFYEGDLLASVLQVEEEFWREYPFCISEVEAIVASAWPLPDELEESLEEFKKSKKDLHRP